jgi:DNA-binding transcriptional MocR family regulator
MSWQQARSVLDDLWLKPRERLVLIALALRCGSDGRSWPSLARLSADTGYGRSTVLFALQNLVASGHLEVIHRAGRSSVLTIATGPDSGRVPVQIPDPPVQYAAKTRPDTGPRSKEEVDKEVAATGSTALRPIAASNGKRADESWGEYRERGGR